MQHAPIRAVIFDMDGLMLDTEGIARDVWTRALAEAGLVINDDIFARMIGRAAADTRRMFGEVYGLSDSAFAQINQRKNEFLRAAYEKNVPIKDGLLALLAELDARRLPRAVATSTCREMALHKLNKAGLVGRFDVIVAGDEIAHGKPAPDIFLAAAQKLNQPAQGCLVLEDSEAGALAGLAANMRVIIVPDQFQPSPEVAARVWRVCASLREVKKFLEAAPAQIR